MSTYSFQVNVSSEQFQTRNQIVENQSRHVSSPAPVGGPTLASGPSNMPQPIIIQYDGKHSRQPYGSGETDEGFTLEFVSFSEFEAWRLAEEESKCVDFFKVDSHTSKANPPRFKEHVKLACSRHTRAGQKKYVKKHPDRPRKMPSKKIEGIGCPATISYKTYVDSDVVRVNYISQHSHEIGPANLPFTRRYRRNLKRRTAVGYYDNNEHDEQTENEDHEPASSTTSEQLQFPHSNTGPSLPPSPPASMEDPFDVQQMDMTPYGNRHQLEYTNTPHPHLSQVLASERQTLLTPHSQIVPLSRTSTPYNPNIPVSNVSPTASQHQNMQHIRHQPTPQTSPHETLAPHRRSRENSAVSMQMHEPTSVTPSHSQFPPFHVQEQHVQMQFNASRQLSISQPTQAAAPQSMGVPPHHSNTSSAPPPSSLILPDRRQMMRDRWDRISNLFGHVRAQAESFEFPDASVTALEMLLVRLHLESPNPNSGASADQNAQNRQHSGHNMMH